MTPTRQHRLFLQPLFTAYDIFTRFQFDELTKLYPLQVDKSFWKDTVHIEFSVFEHDNTDILELLSVDIDSGTEYERVYFSKRNIMAKIADDVEEFYDLNHPGKGAVDDALMGDCVHQKLGEYVVDHIEVVGKFSSKREAMLQVIPMARKYFLIHFCKY